jgi:hypothetical protein
VRILTALLFLAFIPEARAWTQTQVQHIAAGCTVSPCVVSLSATGANHLLVVGFEDNAFTDVMGAPPSGACALPWVHAPNAPAAYAPAGDLNDIYYCLQSNSGITSFSQPVTTFTGTADVIVWEAISTLPRFALDSGANPGNKVANASCTSCSGVPLTLSGNSDFIVVMSGGAGAVSGLTGAGFTYDGTTSFGDGFGHSMTVGSLTAPTTWIASAGLNGAYAVAFQETGGDSDGGVITF